MQANPSKPDDLLRIAGLQQIVGSATDAQKLYKKVLFNNPKHCEALLGLAAIAADHEEWDVVIVNTQIVLKQMLLLKRVICKRRRSKALNVTTSSCIWQSNGCSEP